MTQGQSSLRWDGRRITFVYRSCVVSTAWPGKRPFLAQSGGKDVFSPSFLSSFPYLPSLKTSSIRIWKIDSGGLVLIIPHINYHHLVSSLLACFLNFGVRRTAVEG